MGQADPFFGFRDCSYVGPGGSFFRCEEARRQWASSTPCTTLDILAPWMKKWDRGRPGAIVLSPQQPKSGSRWFQFMFVKLDISTPFTGAFPPLGGGALSIMSGSVTENCI